VMASDNFQDGKPPSEAFMPLFKGDPNSGIFILLSYLLSGLFPLLFQYSPASVSNFANLE
jgi:hypothetical protein